MKAGLCVLVLVLIGGIAGSVWYAGREKERSLQQATALESQVQAVQAELEESRVRERQIASLPPVVVVKTNQSIIVPAKAAPASAMLKDPETRALMRKQQDQSLAKHADRLISEEFARTWNLTPEQTAKAKEFFRERAGAAKDMLNAMMFDGLDDDALAQRGRETKQRVESAEAGLRAALGNDGFDALSEVERAKEDRDRMRRVRGELASSAEPLSKEQEESLFAAFVAERQAFSFRANFSDFSKMDFEHVRDHFSESTIQTHFEDMQQLNERVAERAALFLSPAQIEQLKTTENNHLERSRLTAKMTTELFNKRREN
ncbi:MAG TPA: hypothetical protein VK530_19755 [Candidatus Acidoferrum sp.]|nr:hypothetical protein [Candidatus Acidoferrum sp.]